MRFLSPVSARIRAGWANREHLVAHVGVALAAVVGLLVSLVRDRATVSQFGTTQGFDGFLVGYGWVVFLVQVPAGAVGAAMVPRLVATDGRDAFRGILGRLAALGAGGAILCAAASGTLAMLLLGEPAAIGVATTTLRWLSISIPFMLGCVAFNAVLQVKGRASQGALSSTVRHVAFLGFLLLHSASTSSLGWLSLILATLFAVVVEFGYLTVIVHRVGWLVAPATAAATPSLGLWNETWWLMLNALALGSTNVVDHTMAAEFGEGSVAAVVYGSRGPGAFLAVFALAVGATLLPRLARIRSEGGDIRSVVAVYTLGLAVCGVVVATVGSLFSDELHTVLFGANFEPAVQVIAVDCQIAYWWQVPAYLVVAVNARAIIALGRSVALLWFGLGIALANVGLNHVLSEWIGAVGIAWSTTVCYSVAALIGCGVVKILVHRDSRM